MSKNLLFAVFFFVFLALVGFFLFENNSALETRVDASAISNSQGKNQVTSPIDKYKMVNSGSSKILAATGKGDSRPVIIDNYLARHKSPMSGLGNFFVATADKYGLDFRLMPAIAFQESILGKKIPRDSHNAWGWAIYTGENSGASFKNWTQAIETVAKGLKYNYIDRGLNTPEAIMTRYADSPDGSWAYGVSFAMEEMSPK